MAFLEAAEGQEAAVGSQNLVGSSDAELIQRSHRPSDQTTPKDKAREDSTTRGAQAAIAAGFGEVILFAG